MRFWAPPARTRTRRSRCSRCSRRLPADGQEEVARHLTNLVPDQDYGLMRGYLTNAALPEEVLDVLLDDVLNRPNSLKLPALLEVARNAQHPKAAEAKDFLELFLEEDYGNDWDKWQAGDGTSGSRRIRIKLRISAACLPGRVIAYSLRKDETPN